MKENTFEGFKERAYRILYEKYRKIVLDLIMESSFSINRNRDTGEILEENRPDYIKRKIELFDSFGKYSEWSRRGIISKEDLAVVKTLEYCLDEKTGLGEKIQ